MVFDELHTQPNRKLFDVMTKGSGDARMQPLYFLITTAGNDTKSICYEIHQKAKDIIEGRNETHCSTPTLDTETVHAQFITAYNQLMRDRRLIVEDCELMRTSLTDFDALDAKIEEAEAETQLVAELVNGLVRENASTAQSQDAYLRKYEALTKRYEAATAELDRLQKERTLRSQQDKAMALFIRTLKKQPEVLDAWDDTIWMVMDEKAIVHRDGSLTFVLYNGMEIRVGA